MVGTTKNVGSSSKPPSPDIGDFAALCRELISMDSLWFTEITVRQGLVLQVSQTRLRRRDRRDPIDIHRCGRGGDSPEIPSKDGIVERVRGVVSS